MPDTSHLLYANLDSYDLVKDTFDWKVLDSSYTNILTYENEGGQTNIYTLNNFGPTGFEMLRYIRIPLAAVTETDTCDYFNGIYYTTPVLMKNTVDAYIQLYDNLCETF